MGSIIRFSDYINIICFLTPTSVPALLELYFNGRGGASWLPSTAQPFLPTLLPAVLPLCPGFPPRPPASSLSHHSLVGGRDRGDRRVHPAPPSALSLLPTQPAKLETATAAAARMAGCSRPHSQAPPSPCPAATGTSQGQHQPHFKEISLRWMTSCGNRQIATTGGRCAYS